MGQTAAAMVSAGVHVLRGRVSVRVRKASEGELREGWNVFFF
uniref:Uncharacterized protein n=1 Tax=Anguilla anguilla TaxID=7936 RepID=A0A0E9XVZ9_ANGAN